MTKVIIPFIMALIISLSACRAPKELDFASSSPSNNIHNNAETVIDEKVVNILETIDFTNDLASISIRNSFNYVVVDNVLYLYHDGGQLYHLNKATGFLTGMCDDPLCEHMTLICPNNKYQIFHAVGYDKRIYIIGQQVLTEKENLYYEDFIGYYNVEEGQYTVLESWETIMGYGTASPLQIYNDELYYMKKVSDSSNQLWKSDLNKRNSTVRVDNLDDVFLAGFVIKNDIIYFSDASKDAIYTVDMDFQNQQMLTTESIPIFSFINEDIICTNFGKYSIIGVEWDIEEYVPSDTPFEIFTLSMQNLTQKTIIASHIQGATSLRIDHGIITATPDRPTYLGMEIKDDKKIFYVNPNSGCILISKDQYESLQLLDLSDGIGIDYSVSGVYYIDDSVCIVEFQGRNKNKELEGIYLITDYYSENRKFYRLNYES